jgi:hypothetical protein
MLTPRLQGILDDARAGALPSDATCEAATRCALQLARATGDGRWIEFVIELLDVRRCTLSDALATEISETLQRVRSVDARVLRSYSDTLRGLGRSIERIRSLQNAERLMDLAGRRRA